MTHQPKQGLPAKHEFEHIPTINYFFSLHFLFPYIDSLPTYSILFLSAKSHICWIRDFLKNFEHQKVKTKTKKLGTSGTCSVTHLWELGSGQMWLLSFAFWWTMPSGFNFFFFKERNDEQG